MSVVVVALAALVWGMTFSTISSDMAHFHKRAVNQIYVAKRRSSGLSSLARYKPAAQPTGVSGFRYIDEHRFFRATLLPCSDQKLGGVQDVVGAIRLFVLDNLLSETRRQAFMSQTLQKM